MIDYKLVKGIINALGLVEIIIDMMVQYHGLSDSIINDRRAIFMFKFWSSLYYFLSIKWWLSTTFYLQMDGQTKWQDSIIEVYLCGFINWEQNDWARLLLMTEFTYINSKNASRSHTTFKLNCGYNLRMLYSKKVDLRSQSKSADKLSVELRELMIVCQKNFYYAQDL